MKRLKRCCWAAVVSLSLVTSTFAGHMDTNGANLPPPADPVEETDGTGSTTQTSQSLQSSTTYPATETVLSWIRSALSVL